ncbi:hypothetical protein STAQ_37340 [Allostella sp. ATCC 35155]|nr:hypothetical protein STAQ_37340 [Stella sp. ATCC 35155]
MTAADAAILFHPQLYEVPGAGKPFGATVASSAFLAALARHSGRPALPVVTASGAGADQVAAVLRALGAPDRVRPTTAERAGLLHLPNPSLAQAAWERHRRGAHAWSLTGVAHAVASLAAFEALAALVTAPVMPWDALVCPSQAVRATVAAVMAGERDYLAWRLGAAAAPPEPLLPVIPLGVDAAAMAASADERTRWRAELGLAEEDVVLLFVGRLSAARKANPLPMWLAAEAAAQARPGRRLVLVLAGWFAGEADRAQFTEGAAALCPSVPQRVVDGSDPVVRRGIWSAADIFVSLVDNVQETFGLTPLEAMAAGLPVVASDWDGYRETVREGVDGFLVPTAMPAGAGGEAFIHAHEAGRLNQGAFLGAVAATVAVDAAVAADRIGRLADDPDLRRRMGTAGRERAQAYDWPGIVRRYLDLWDELGARRRAAKPEAPPPRGARPDPWVAFAHYPTEHLTATTRLRLVAGVDAAARRQWAGLPQDDRLFLTPAERRAILDRLAAGPATVREMAPLLPAGRAAALLREAAALRKLGVVEADG